MTRYTFEIGDVTAWIVNADVFEGLKKLKDESVDCVVTSPPYWGLRDYGEPGQIGQEPTLQEHIDKLVSVFREVRRVLRSDGTLWLNYGDAYCGGGGFWAGAPSATVSKSGKYGSTGALVKGGIKPGNGFKTKDLMLMPSRLALSLQADSWYVRSEIIWHKPNPMPESVRDRPTSAHEKLFLLTKSERYFYDADSVKEAAVAKSLMEMDGGAQKNADGSNANDGRSYIGKKGNAKGFRGGSYVGGKPGPRTEIGNIPNQTFSRNLRNVWTIATAPYKGAHFATFPPKLIEPCIKAGCPEGGIVLDPFAGSGTVAQVASSLGRNSIGIELNRKYCALIYDRLEKLANIEAAA